MFYIYTNTQFFSKLWRVLILKCYHSLKTSWQILQFFQHSLSSQTLEEEATGESYRDFEITTEVWPLLSRSSKWLLFLILMTIGLKEAYSSRNVTKLWFRNVRAGNAHINLKINSRMWLFSQSLRKRGGGGRIELNRNQWQFADSNSIKSYLGFCTRRYLL